MTSARPNAITLRPSWWSVFAFGQPWLAAGLFLIAAAWVSQHFLDTPLTLPFQIGLGLVGLSLLQGTIRRCCRKYTVTNSHARVQAGVLSRIDSSLPLAAVSQSTRSSSLFERLVGAGTISLGGNDGPLLRFLFVPRAATHLAAIRSVIQSSRMPTARPIPVIGLSGGIGAGKSTVARAFAAQNALVIDSDSDARAALNFPHVRDKLVQWWGPTILTAEGLVDRKAVAAIVFATPAERERLEALVHPIVRADRAQVIARAAAEGRTAAVIDAPLLFEAGSDAECDLLVFVDTPRATRLARIAASRGWDEAELDRREQAQLPLEEKRRRSHHTISNDAGPEALAAQVQAILALATARLSPEITGLPDPSGS